MFKYKVNLFVIVITLCFQSGFAADAISLSKIKGYDPETGGLMTNMPVRFYLNYEIDSVGVSAIGNAFHLLSYDSAVWQPLTATQLAPLLNISFVNVIPRSVNGSGADTIDFLILTDGPEDFPPYFNGEIAYIETRFDDSQIGKFVEFDTAPAASNSMIWVLVGPPDIVSPQWIGTQVFEIVDCCTGNRGDVSGDGTGPNIVDVARLVDKLFRNTFVPPCDLEADVNSDGTAANILDLNFLINYSFRNGPVPGPCP